VDYKMIDHQTLRRSALLVCTMIQAVLGTSPYPPSPVISDIQWAPIEEIVRQAPGADNWPCTWGDDDRLYTAGGDSFGAFQKSKEKYSLILSTIYGDPPDITGQDINLLTKGQGRRGIKASGLLMVAGRLYMWARNVNLQGQQSQLGWSDDHGKTWTWADWKFDTFGYCTFLNYGQDYKGARDDVVYMVSHDHPDAYETADRFVLTRVPKDQIHQRGSYEFFNGSPEAPSWTMDIAKRGAVFTHPGRCRRSGITFNPGLGRYLWWQQNTDGGEDTRYAGGFGVFDAPQPWGPWTTVYYTQQWDVGPGETGCFPTKWMSPDGKTLHLVFSGDDAFSVRKATLTLADG
jgi:hypothetical protein